MNIKEISLDEIELQSVFVEEGISALLHTILFVRAPNLVKPEDHLCTRLAPLTYAKCGPSDVDQTVNEAIDMLQKSRATVGPQLSKGILLLTFFEKRENKGFFGLIRNEEKLCFERWKIPVLINEHEVPKKPFVSSAQYQTTIELERQHIFDYARNQVQQRILYILETANKSIDHVPSSLYEYEIEVTGPSGERKEQSLVTRLIHSPMI